MTYHEALKNAEQRLNAAGVPDSACDAELLLEKATGKEKARILLEWDNEFPKNDLERYEALLQRRIRREPLQYIFGTWEFMGLDFICNPACLIPRQDTELLVITAMEEIDLRSLHSGTIRLLDLCTGSGCVVVSTVKLARPQIEAIAADISTEALEVAARNAELNGVKIDFRRSDMFENIPETEFDIITANPPYIETEVIKGLNPEINRYEPMIALDGGADGLKHYRSIIAGAKGHLKHGGRLFMEIGDTQGHSVAKLLEEAGYREVEVRKDLAGLDRVVCASWYEEL
ncbi:MAG: peptide chain release factor N(5)-glutamine methyltransferase [Lachnospiraceae bacterium]|nr:peptide chain release factor N(5)-glutamine methyltransferase [Lachnospiraceae bacterium]